MADKRRRKSLSIFRPKHELSDEARVPPSPVKKRIESPLSASPIDIEGTGPMIRPRTLQKSSRASIFGSLRSLHSLDGDEKTFLSRSDSKTSVSHEETEKFKKGLFGNTVLHYGEVQSLGSSVFKKKSQFMVLTESHLIRFKGQNKAAEMFPSIPPSLSRSNTRMSSIGSYHELQMSAYQDITSGIPLEHIVSVHRVEDGRPLFTVEVSHLDERSRRASAMQLAVMEPREVDAWTKAIRTATMAVRTMANKQLQEATIEYVAKVVERDRDYDPNHFHVFKVAQRPSLKHSGKSSTEDLTKLNSSICYLAVGLHNVHLVPVTKPSSRSSNTSLNEMDSQNKFGITTLLALKVHAEEDAFQLTFKSPLHQPHTLTLLSNDAADIALCLRSASEYLRPEWLRQPFAFDVPKVLEDQMEPPAFPQEDLNCFDRTLIAYCAAYNIDTSRICYTVDPNCEDSPGFQLLPPRDGKAYSVLELLAVFRALRYNETFVTVSFANINLTSLRFLHDTYATDLDSNCLRSGTPLNFASHFEMPVLCQEVRALALKSRRLRRLDFTNCFPQFSHHANEEQSCGIPEALAPLCKKSLTNVDWIVLNGVRLAESDVNFLVDIASERASHLRALEVGESGLSVHDIDVLLSTLANHANTMEVINISGAQGRFSPELFQREIAAFTYIRRLNLTRIQRTAGPEPLIAPETLLTWRLEALYLSQTVMNDLMIDTLSGYLASPRSEILHELYLDQCGLSGRDLAKFFRAMTRERGRARLMHVSASENRLKLGREMLIDAIRESYGPFSLTMRMMDFEKEHHFRDLIVALANNTTLRSLDISRASLPYDASNETCEALKDMFATNTTLEELDISGEQTHLDATRFGIGLNHALHGLEQNKTLRMLRIEHQGLGLRGANTLAAVLELNDSLLEIYCEHNEINLQSFSVLVDAVEQNKSLLYLPNLDHDRVKSIDKVVKGLEGAEKSESLKIAKPAMTLKKTFTGALASRTYRSGHKARTSISSAGSATEQDALSTVSALNEKWDAEVIRLQDYLYRNHCFANGIPWNEERRKASTEKRSITGESLSQQLNHVALEPGVDDSHSSGLGFLDEKFGRHSPIVFQFPED